MISDSAFMNKSSDLVSIVTVSRNAGCDLLATIDSVAKQIGVNVECVIQDGMSDDDSPNIVASRYPDIVRLQIKKDSGIYSAMNMASTRVRGSYVVFLNAGDTLVGQNALSEWVAHFQNADRVGVVVCSYLNGLDGTITLYPRRLSRLFLFRNNLCHQAQMWRRESLVQALPFDETYRVFADRALLLKAVSMGVKLKTTSSVYVNYKDGGFSASKANLKLKNMERIRTEREFFTKGENIKYSIFRAISFQWLRKFFLRAFRKTVFFRGYKRIANFVNHRFF